MATWINEDVVIDFELSHVMKELVARAEALDKAKDVVYTNVADGIDHFAKQEVIDGYMTPEQREKLLMRYCDYYGKL